MRAIIDILRLGGGLGVMIIIDCWVLYLAHD